MSKTRTIYVKCTFTLPVEIPDDPDYNEVFDIEENHCPGTGLVGLALEEAIERSDKDGICWACRFGGTNEIVPAPKEHQGDE